ncbi:telomerase reverse transcriptase [Astyanax mexicanus]|uniref:Telomerase reverse transcriptase n=1 Tax=Astyanax mexicanus TaxID=7994 RepID=A0A8T2MI36_ASTMX|nr:telomerase reverse transcriptase [Astyanax mexicanus]
MSGVQGACTLLQGVYGSVRTLQQFADSVQYPDGRGAALLRNTDPARLAGLMRGLVVCTDSRLPRAASRAQLATLPEVLAFVLNHMKRKKRRNVLNFGYHYSDRQGNWDPFKFHGSLSQSAAFISGSELWAKINQRLGTEVTKFLLQECAVFVTAPPSCLVQLCGVPLYDMVPVRSWCGFFLTSGPPVTWKRSDQGRDLKNRTTVSRNKRKNEKERIETDGSTSGTKVRTRKTRKIRHHARKTDLPTEENQPKACSTRVNTDIENSNTENTKKRKKEEENDDNEVEEGEQAKDERSQAKRKCVDNEEQSNVCLLDPIETAKTESQKPEKVEPASTGHASMQGVSSWKPSDQPPSCPSHCFIRVLSMLYCGRGMKGFLLNRKVRGGVGGPKHLQGAELVRIIFLQGNTYLSGAEPKPQKLPRRFFSMVPIFSQLIKKHRKCPYAHFLRKKCSGGKGKEDMLSLLVSHCSAYRVYLFVREVLRYVIPDQLWGSEHNLLTFLSQVKHFLRMGRFERLSLGQVMWRMRVSDCHWVGHKKRHCPSEHRYREWILGQFLLWLMESFVVGLVKAMFYVTESMGTKHALQFYRRDIWTKLQDMAFREHLSKGQWEALTPQQVAALPKSTVKSRIRFIPKASGMRPITRLSGAGSALQQFQTSVRDLQNVLGLCVRENPVLLGSTVWGRQDIHRVLSSIAPQHAHNPHPLYFVKVDVSGAYDSLPHAKLLEVVGEVLDPVLQDCFFLRHYAKVWRDSSLGIRKQFCTKADMLEMVNMKGFAVEEQNSGRLRDAVLVERYSVEVRGAEVLQFFKEMLSSYVIQHDQRWFRQVRGVPQGSAVSTMLCNLCYGHMENSLLKNITEKGGCLMRLVDDFLLITPKLSKAVHFLKTLLAGVPEYGCEINPQKVVVNFPVCDELVIPGISELPLQSLFPWCGLLISTQTLDIYNNYSGYAGQSVRYSQTLGSAPSAVAFMRQKLLMILKLKCNAIFLDLRVNSVEAVFKNIYKLLLLQALRFHVCVKNLPLGQNITTNLKIFLNIIWSSAKTVHHSIRTCNSEGVADPVGGVLQYESVELLCCLAFVGVLSRYRSTYRFLLPRLHTRRRSLCSKLRGLRLARVLQAATPRIPPDFTKIRC